jgi:hypothetical protein
MFRKFLPLSYLEWLFAAKTGYYHKKSEEEVMSLGGLFESNFERHFDDTLMS